jgi:hypothetical protein
MAIKRTFGWVLLGNIAAWLFSILSNRGEFFKTRDSCTEPGQPTNMSRKCIFESQAACMLIEANDFQILFMAFLHGYWLLLKTMGT